MRVRIHPNYNYKAIFFNGKTLRIAIDPTKDIYGLPHPEFYDIKITNKCFGNCPYCYQNSTRNDEHFDNIIEKTKEFFGPLSDNNKPFQVAIGGGEPTLHPNFIELLKTFKELGIEPNYTTNGMNLTDEILEATKEYCGGVAISCHPHLRKYWEPAIYKLNKLGIVVNLHLVISDKASQDNFMYIYNN